VMISDVKGKYAEELIRYLLRQIIFSKPIYPKLSKEEKLFLMGLLSKSEKELIHGLRSAIVLLTSKSKFILLIDDFNLFDQLASDLLLEIIPLFQVNNIKIVMTESSEHNFLSARINNIKEITLGPFTEDELLSFLRRVTAPIFLKRQLRI